MSKIKRSWDKLSDEEKKQAKEELIQFFESHRDEKIGIIAAEEIIHFFLRTVGSKLYNQGVMDAKRIMENRMEDLKFDIDDLLEI